jgi:hypothetical protein
MREGFQKLVDTIREVRDAVKSSQTDLTPALDKQTRTLERAITKIERLIDRAANPDIDVAVDTSAMEAAVRELCTAMKAMQMPDTTKMEQLLGSVLISNEHTKKAIVDGLADVKAAVAGVSVKVPDTVKIDDMQVRAISAGRMPLNPAPLAPRSINVRTLSLSNANTEYSITLSAGTTGYFVKLRAQNVLLLMATATGKLPTSGDGSAYMQVPQNGMLSPMGLDVGGKTLYFQTGSASQTLELQEFIA